MRTFRKTCAIAGAVLVATTATLSARADDRALDAYVRDVLTRSPSLRARASTHTAYREDAIATGRWPDPSVAVMVDRIPERMGGDMPMLRYQVSQMVPWPGKLSLMRNAAERQGDAAAADVDVRRLDLRLQAKRGWYMLLLNSKRREVNRAARNLAATIAAASLGRYGSGVGGHHEIARAQVEVSALDVQLIDVEGERASVVAMLNALRDQPLDTAVGEPSGDPSPPMELAAVALVDRAISLRPELRGMRAMEAEATAMASLARREVYPDLMGSVWVNQMIGSTGIGPTVGVMVGGTIPVFGVSRQSHRAAAFDARAQAATNEQAAMRAMVRYEVSDALIRVQTTTRQLDLVRTVALPRARESFEASLAGFGAGTLDVIGVLDARRALQSAHLVAAEAQVAREMALADLERAVGGPIPGAGK